MVIGANSKIHYGKQTTKLSIYKTALGSFHIQKLNANKNSLRIRSGKLLPQSQRVHKIQPGLL